MKGDELVWHYTTGQCFKAIVESGVILPATACITPGERPIVWFSSNPIWEKTSTKTIRSSNGEFHTATFDELFVVGGGLVRFGVTRGVARHDWAALKKKSRIPTAIARGLEKVAHERGASPSEWFGSFAPVPRDQWAAIEVYDTGGWVRVWSGDIAERAA